MDLHSGGHIRVGTLRADLRKRQLNLDDELDAHAKREDLKCSQVADLGD